MIEPDTAARVSFATYPYAITNSAIATDMTNTEFGRFFMLFPPFALFSLQPLKPVKFIKKTDPKRLVILLVIKQ